MWVMRLYLKESVQDSFKKNYGQLAHQSVQIKSSRMIRIVMTIKVTSMENYEYP